MITEEEKQEIIDKAVEKSLLMIPEVVGNLILNQLAAVKINKQFYDNYPEFKNFKEVVQYAVEHVEGLNPGMDYKKVLDQAVPIIKERIKMSGALDMIKVSKPSRNLSSLNITSDNGEL
jgi:hypothetical protein